MIRTTTHHFDKNTNTSKLDAYKAFRLNGIKILKWYVDYIWLTRIEFGKYVLDIANQQYSAPSFISIKNINCPFPGSARLKSCISTQACGIIKAVLAKCSGNPTKPAIRDNANLELSSLILDVSDSKEFDFWIRLKCLGSPQILLPIRHHRQSRRYYSIGKKLNSFLLGVNYVDIRWEVTPLENNSSISVGADQGLKTVLSLSDNNTSDSHLHPHGWTLDKVLDRMVKKKKGSRAFRRTQKLRENFINWSINKMNLSQYKTIKLEDIRYLRYKKSSSRKMSHWSYTLIKQKVESVCELAGVRLLYNAPAYRSQRCSQCGLVKKSQRIGKLYKCICGYTADADVNAALNNAVELPPIPKDFLNQRNSLLGFFWNPSGIKKLERAPIVLATNKSM